MWDIAIKITAVIVAPFCVFTVSNIFEFRAFMNQKDRLSTSDGLRLEKIILEESKKTQLQIFTLEKELSDQFVRHKDMETILSGWSQKNK